jgi:hypothetical protein
MSVIKETPGKRSAVSSPSKAKIGKSLPIIRGIPLPYWISLCIFASSIKSKRHEKDFIRIIVRSVSALPHDGADRG